jgi:hypothetical protein
MDSFIEFFGCNICSDVDEEMYSVSCGHIFCGYCVARLHDTLKCPMCNKKCIFADAVKSIAWSDAMACNKEALSVTCSRCGVKHLSVNTEQHERNCSESVVGCKACGKEFVRKKQRSHRCQEMTISKISAAYIELGELRKSFGDIAEERDHLKRQLDEFMSEQEVRIGAANLHSYHSVFHGRRLGRLEHTLE